MQSDSVCLLLQTTALREVWGKLYQLACDTNEGTDNVAAVNRRILTSLKPNDELVFLVDLTDSGKFKAVVQHAQHV